MSDDEKEIKRLTIDRVTNGFILHASEMKTGFDTGKVYVCSDVELTHLVCKLLFMRGKR